MGDKSRAKHDDAARAGVPLVPGRPGPAVRAPPRRPQLAGRGRLPGAAEGGRRRRRAGHAARGRPGRQSRTPTAWRRPRREASFGDGGMYLEKAVVEPRHVEMQVLADGEGGVLVLGERDCSVQRRHQKLIEEGPSPGARRPATRAAMADAARLRLHGLRLRNAGTVEFLLDADGAVLLHRDEHPPAGRAPGLGAAHRHRPRLSAAAARRRRARCPPPAWRRCAATRSSSASTARTPRRDFLPGGRHRQPLPAAARAPACASTPTPTRATGCRRSTTRCWPS